MSDTFRIPDAGLEDAIAIIGMAGRFPGARTLNAFWANLAAGVDSVSAIPDEELLAAGVSASMLREPGFLAVKGRIDGPDAFDAAFFGYQRTEATVMDPQQRVFLEVAWEALEHAGYSPEAYEGLIGAFAGASRSAWFSLVMADQDLARRAGEYPVRLGADKDYLTTRASYKFDLRGPSFNVQTACSTSLVSVALACQALHSYQCDMALAGGVSIPYPRATGRVVAESGIYSPAGRCRAFDAAASGIVDGEGAGIVVLKRLQDAINDRDCIHAVIRGCGLNNDGSAKVGFSAPSVDGQATAIRMALASAGVDPQTVSCIEAHGTGTALGDPVEVAALAHAYDTAGGRSARCAIGSVKTNIGHLDVAAGIAGLIKIVLALQHRQIPPSLHFASPNPAIDFANSPFFVNTSLRDWSSAGPRRAGVSSFGLGGTNAHVIVEEAPVLEEPAAQPVWDVLPLSARTVGALERGSQLLADGLGQIDAPAFADVAFTLQSGRKPQPIRRAIVARDHAGAVSRLLTPLDGGTHVRASQDRSVVFTFPGGGAQYPSAACDLIERLPSFAGHVEECCSHFDADVALAVQGLLRITPSAVTDQHRELAAKPSVGLPLLFTIEHSLAMCWKGAGVTPAALIGHSMGEYTAACISGVMSLEAATRLVQLRGSLFDELPPGGMLAVSASADHLAPFLDEVDLAAVNGPASSVLSGSREALAQCARRLERAGIDFVPVHIATPAHSALVEPILPRFRAALASTPLEAPRIRFVSNVTGDWITGAQATDPDYWVAHLRHTVRFSAGLQTVLALDRPLLVEVGPGRTLSTIARQHAGVREDVVIVESMRHGQDSRDDAETLLTAAGHLWTSGVALSWDSLRQRGRRRRVPLPTYSFDREVLLPQAVTAHLEEHTKTAMTESNVLEAAPPSAAGAGTPALEVRTPQRELEIRDRLRAIIRELAGLEPQALVGDATFIELGFDSLSLTQVSQAVTREFGVRVRFRQLLEALPTVETLARHIDQALPSAPVSSTPAGATRAPVTPAPAAVLERLGPGATSSTVIEAVVQQQLALMAEQLAVLRQAVSGSTTAPRLGVSRPAPEQVQPAGSGLAAPMREPARFGPYTALDKRRGQLTSRQQKALDDLVARYTSRTRTSRQLTEAHRPTLADPRAITGFSAQWKELIYQIAMARSHGSRMWDVDGHEYVDFTMNFGASLFGHTPQFLVEALERQMRSGLDIGTLSPLAGPVSRQIAAFTRMDRVAFANTGSDAIMGALRAARTVTGRDGVIVFAGGYHGMNDEMLVQRGGGLAGPVPAVPGVPRSAVANALVLDYADPQCLEQLEAHLAHCAAVIVEPIQSRRPSLDAREIIRAVRELTAKAGTALIFDELITGFRLHPGGAQAWLGIDADLATYGKVLSGGVPIAAIAGRREFMQAFDGGLWQFGDDSQPEGDVTFYGGTYTRHPLGLAAAGAVLDRLEAEGPSLQASLNRRTADLCGRLNAVFERHRVSMRMEHCGSLFRIKFAADGAGRGGRSSLDASSSTLDRLLFFYLREQGVHIWDRAAFLATTHTDEDLDRFVNALHRSVAEMVEGGLLEQATRQPHPPEGDGDPRPLRDDRCQANIDTTVPLTPGQEEIWLAAQVSTAGSMAFTQCVSLRLSGQLDVATLRLAVREFLARHEGLRIVIDPISRRQRVRPIQLQMPVVDLSDLDQASADTRFQQILHEQSTSPFDLEHGPLFRLQLVKLSATENVLLFTPHHVVCDGWSMNIFAEELGPLYHALVKGQSPSLPVALRFTEWVRQTLADASETDARYWRDQFATPVPPLELPTNRPRVSSRTYEAGVSIHTIGGSTLERVKRSTSQSGGTMFSRVLTAYAILLHRLTGQKDIVVGCAVAGQSALDNSRLVGHCVSLLPVRIAIEPSAPVHELTAFVRRQLLDALEHQNYTYLQLITQLNLERDPARPPLLSTLMTYEAGDGDPGFGPGLDVTLRSHPRTHCNFDLELMVTAVRHELVIWLYYNRDVFDGETVQRWGDSLVQLVTALGDGTQRPMRDLPVLSEPQLQEITRTWNRTAAMYPLCTAGQMVATQIARSPDAVAVEDEQGGRLTYAELGKRAAALAARLRTAAVRRGEPVGVYVGRSVDMVAALLAIWEVGAPYLPLDPRFPPARIASMLADAGVQVIVTESMLASTLPGNVRTIRLDEAAAADDATIDGGPAQPLDVAYVIYTSGSTGTPKGVELTHRNLVNLFTSFAAEPGFTARDVMLSVTTIAFDIATLELMLPLVTGGRVVVASRNTAVDAAAIVKLLNRHRATVMQATPATWRMFIETGQRLPNGLVAWCGGESLPRDLAEALLTQGVTLWNLYGPTETTIYSTGHRVTSGTGRIPIGRPLANTQVYVLDAYRRVVPVGVSGELYIGGHGVGKGYRHRDDLTAEGFIPDPFCDDPQARLYRTGDAARFRSDGSLEWLDRLDDQVKLRGFRIELAEIEAALRRQPGITDAAVVLRGSGHEARLLGYVTPSAADGDTLRDALSTILPEYMVPALIVALDALPRTASGKMDRKALPDRQPSPRDVPADEGPRIGVESEMALLFRDVLGVSTIGRQDDFFRLGGHSLLAIQLVTQIKDRFGKSLPFGTFFQRPTIAALAELIDDRPRASRQTKPELVLLQDGHPKPPIFIVSGIGGEVFSFVELARHLGSEQPTYGLVPPPEWEQLADISVDVMAAHYLAVIRDIADNGPIHLVGYCAGAITAFEMARRLATQNIRVTLGVIDYSFFDEKVKVSTTSRLKEILTNLPWWIVDDVLPSGPAAMAGRIKSNLRGILRNCWPWRIGSQKQATDIRDKLGMWRYPKHQAASLERYYRAFTAYQPRPAHVATTLFRPRTRPLFASREAAEDLGWSRLTTGRVDVHILPGSHDSLMKPPFVSALAAGLREMVRGGSSASQFLHESTTARQVPSGHGYPAYEDAATGT